MALKMMPSGSLNTPPDRNTLILPTPTLTPSEHDHTVHILNEFSRCPHYYESYSECLCTCSLWKISSMPDVILHVWQQLIFRVSLGLINDTVAHVSCTYELRWDELYCNQHKHPNTFQIQLCVHTHSLSWLYTNTLVNTMYGPLICCIHNFPCF